jgi:hypothetical protein
MAKNPIGCADFRWWAQAERKSEMGHSRQFGDVRATSALPRKPTFIVMGACLKRAKSGHERMTMDCR